MAPVISGQIQNRELVLEWQIRDFFSIVEQQVCSPSFNFAGERWKLVMWPNGSMCYESEGFIDIFLERESSGHAIKLEFSFALKTRINEMYDEKQLIHNFVETFAIYGWISYIMRDKLSEEGSELAPSGHLTWVCRMKHPEPIDAASANNTSGSTVKGKILEDFKQLLQSQENCDVVIRVRGQEFPAHKNILTARSPVFAANFRNDMNEKKTNAIDIEDLDPAIFPNFLLYLYCEDLENLSAENVFSLFTAADKYEVMDLRAKCLEFMSNNLSVYTFCDTVTTAMRHSEAELIRLSTDFFVAHADKIIATVQWKSFVIQNPIQSNELFMKFVASVKR